MHSVINQLALTGKPFAMHDVHNEFSKRGISLVGEYRKMVESYLLNMLDQEFIITAKNSKPRPHPNRFQASELFLYLGEIAPDCVEKGIDLNSLALRLSLTERKTK